MFELNFLIITEFQVWQYYLLPPEEQRMPGVKNPMCIAFPRIGKIFYRVIFGNINQMI